MLVQSYILCSAAITSPPISPVHHGALEEETKLDLCADSSHSGIHSSLEGDHVKFERTIEVLSTDLPNNRQSVLFSKHTGNAFVISLPSCQSRPA